MTLPFGLDPASFFAGAALVLVLAFATFLISVWWRDVTSPFRPQMVVQTTKKTPWQVVGGALASAAQYVGLALMVAAGVLVVFFGFSFQEVRLLGLAGLILLVLGSLFKLITK
jgi:hypothetical protein